MADTGNLITLINLKLVLCSSIWYNQLFSLPKKDITMTDKPLPDLKTFIENVNKKDKLNGKKVRFGFTKRKRK